MKIITGTVSEGRIVFEGEALREGEKVTILSREGDETFRLSPEEKRILVESVGQSKRGEFVDADALLSELDESN